MSVMKFVIYEKINDEVYEGMPCQIVGFVGITEEKYEELWDDESQILDFFLEHLKQLGLDVDKDDISDFYAQDAYWALDLPASKYPTTYVMDGSKNAEETINLEIIDTMSAIKENGEWDKYKKYF